VTAGGGAAVPRLAVAALATTVAIPLAYVSAAAPLLGIGALLGGVVVALVVLRADLLLLALVSVLPWEDSLHSAFPSFSVVKLLGLLLIGAWALRALRASEPLRLPGTLPAVTVMWLAIGFSFIMSPDQTVGLSKTASYALFILFFFIVVQLVRGTDDVRRVLRVFCASAAVAGAWGIYLFVAGRVERASGPIQDPNGFAYVIGAALPLTGYLVVNDRGRRALWLVAFVVITGAVLASLSRGAFVGLAALLVWGVLTGRVPVRGGLLGLAIVASVAALGFALFGPIVERRVQSHGRIASKNVTSRQAFWSGALRMAADRPLTGVGPDRFGREAQNYVRNNPIALRHPVVHNTYLEVLAESGIVALLGFLAYLSGTWRVLMRARGRARTSEDVDATHLVTALQSTLLFALVAGFFISAQLTTPFWLIGGLATVFAGVEAERAATTARWLGGVSPEPA
jgi:putative inorganic carbon (hco3(-)) transporter